MSFGTQTRKRGQPTSTAQGRDYKRKECEHGMACPFRHEYQHSLEFSHSIQPIRAPQSSSSSASSSKPAGREATERAQTASDAFRGGGIRLGSGDVRKPDVFDRSKFLQRFDSQRQVANDVCRAAAGNTAKAGNNEPWSPSKGALCDLCHSYIPLDAYSKHLEDHEQGIHQPRSKGENVWGSLPSRDTHDGSLRRAQDREYEEGILKDIEKISVMEHSEFVNRQSELARQEQEALIESRREAVRCRQLEEHQLAKMKLRPEPNENDGQGVVAIRFTLPSGKRTTRRFRIDATTEDIFVFLKTIEELIHLKYELKFVVGSRVISDKTSMSLREAGLTSNTNLVVVMLDLDDDAVEDLLADRDPRDGSGPSSKRRKTDLGKDALLLPQPIALTSNSCKKDTMRRKRPREDDIIDLT